MKEKFREFCRQFFQNRMGVIGFGILVVFVLIAIFAPFIAPYDPYERVGAPMLAPCAEHLLGTNDIGQDILSELIYGTRISLIMGVAAAFIAVFIGSVIGIVAGYFGGRVDTVLMRIVDIVMTIPSTPLMILLAAFVGPSFWNIVLVIGCLSWATVARIVRSQVLTVRNRGYIESVKTLGGKPGYIIIKHILPPTMSIIISRLILMSSRAIMSEASMSFLGLGDPTHKSWGIILYYAQSRSAFLTNAWLWWILPAGLMITLLSIAFSYVGNAMEEIVNPRLRKE